MVLAVAALAIGLAERSLGDERPMEFVIPFDTTTEMRSWAERVVPASGAPRRRFHGLVEGVLGPAGLDLREVWAPTHTAAEVYASGRANCAGLAYLLVGLARAVELPAFFALVDLGVAPAAHDEGIRVLERHLVAGLGPLHEATLVDFSGTFSGSEQAWHSISDATAVAIYYSNRGAEAILTERLLEAGRWLETATRIDPDLSDAWLNLGVARRRLGDAPGAEAAYREALRSDPGARHVYRSLTRLLLAQGRIEEASALSATAGTVESSSPFFHWSLVRSRLKAGRFDEARTSARRAQELAGGGVPELDRPPARTDGSPKP